MTFLETEAVLGLYSLCFMGSGIMFLVFHGLDLGCSLSSPGTLYLKEKKLKQYWGLGSLCLWVGPGLQPINLEIICSVFVIIRIHKKRANLVPKVKALGRTWCHD